MAALVGGLVALVLGIIFIILWFGYFVKGLMAALPALFILGGALAFYLGIEEWKDKRSAEKFEKEPEKEPDTSKLKEEVENIKKEVEDLKKE